MGPVHEEGRWLNVEPLDLRKQVGFLRRRGFQFHTAAELREQPKGRGACLTFDDAYQSFLTYGVEILEGERATGSVYVVPSLVGESSQWDGEKAGPLGNWDLINKASKLGIEVGNHTMTHRALGDLSLEDQKLEIAEAQKVLIERGYEPKSFCLPYGSFNSETAHVISELGFDVGLTIRQGFVRELDNRMLLNRVMVSYSDRVPGLWYKIFVKPILKQIQRRA